MEIGVRIFGELSYLVRISFKIFQAKYFRQGKEDKMGINGNTVLKIGGGFSEHKGKADSAQRKQKGAPFFPASWKVVIFFFSAKRDIKKKKEKEKEGRKKRKVRI